MKQSAISNVRWIANDKEGKAINLVIIDLVSGVTIIRQLKQFITDLQGSARLRGVNVDTINSVNHPALLDEYSALFPTMDGTASLMGDYKTYKAGETYVDENPQSEDFGKKKEYKQDGVRVEGFLRLTPNGTHTQMEMNAKAEANFKAQLRGLFSTVSATTSADSAGEINIDDLPEDLVEEIAGANEPAMETAPKSK